MGHRLTEPDRETLEFIAEHRLVLPAHVAVLLGISPGAASKRLSRLAEAGFLRRQGVFRGQPDWSQITKRGLGAIRSELPVPRPLLYFYAHDVGVAWLWLAARAGAFGSLESVTAERRLRSEDGSRDRDPEPAEPHAIRLGGAGPHGRERLHYPDLVLRTSEGRRIALELELSPKSRTKLGTILGGYGADPRIDGVVYLVESPAIARAVSDTARRLGVSDRVVIQRIRSTIPVPRPAPAIRPERTLDAPPPAPAIRRERSLGAVR